MIVDTDGSHNQFYAFQNGEQSVRTRPLGCVDPSAARCTRLSRILFALIVLIPALVIATRSQAPQPHADAQLHVRAYLVIAVTTQIQPKTQLATNIVTYDLKPIGPEPRFEVTVTTTPLKLKTGTGVGKGAVLQTTTTVPN